MPILIDAFDDHFGNNSDQLDIKVGLEYNPGV